MRSVSDLYGGAYLSGLDLAGRTYRLAIEAVAEEEMGDEREAKLVVAFKGARKSLVLNKTNASVLASLFGDHPNTWIGQTIELFTVPTTFGGRTYDGIRVRAVEMAQTSALMSSEPVGVPASQTKAAMQHAAAVSDEVPF